MSYHRSRRGVGALGATATCPSGYTFDGSQCQPDAWDCTTPSGERGKRNAQGTCELLLKPSPYYPPGQVPGASSTNTPPPGQSACPTGFFPWAPSPTGCAPSNVMQPCWDLSTQKPGVVNVLGMCEPTGYLPGVHPTTMAPAKPAPGPGPNPAPPAPKMSCPSGYVYRPDINPDRCIHEKFGQPCSTPAGPGTVDAFGTCMFKGAGEPCSGPAGEPGVWRSDGVCLYTAKGGNVTPVPPPPVPPMPPVPAQAGMSLGGLALGALLFCGVVVVGLASSD